MSSLPVNNLYAEQAILGSLLIDNTTIDDIGDYLQTEDFSSVFHRDVYRAIKYLLKSKQSADIICVSKALAIGQYETENNESKYRENESFIDLCEIANSTFTPKNIKHYAEIIKQSSIDRKMLKAANDVIANIANQKDNRLDIAQQTFSAISDDIATDTTPIGDILDSVVTAIDERQSSDSEIIGAPTGFSELDKITHGLHGGDLIVLAGRPSMGKTLLAMNIAEHLSINKNKSTLVFSLEMKKEQLIERSISSIARIETNLIRSGKLTNDDFHKITSIIPDLYNAKLFIHDNANLSVSDLRAKCRRIMRETKLSLIIIDYISLMTGEGENETLRIANISRGLKLLARDLNVPIIAISQLNRSLEHRNDKRPCMGDLRQSGAIEQDADLILFIYRDEIYNKESKHKGIAEVIIAKHRNGSVGTINLVFNGQYCRFDNYTGAPLSPLNIPNHNHHNPFMY